MRSNLLVSLLLLAGACSSGPDNPAVYENPDPLASKDLPNECMQNHWTDLQGNINWSSAWSGPVSTYRKAPATWPRAMDWSPLEASTGSTGTGSEGEQLFVHLSGSQRLPAACAAFGALVRSSEGQYDTPTFMEHHSVLVHHFPTFAFPAADQPLPTSTAPIEVAPDSSLVITYEKPTMKPDHTFDYSFLEVVKTQTFALSNIKCAKPFTVTPIWSVDSGSQPPFCRDAAGNTRQCLSYAAQYTGDDCTFEILDGTFEASDGTSFHANLGGYFKKNEGGYRLAITNVEFLGAAAPR
jgi:hypothetical protein